MKILGTRRKIKGGKYMKSYALKVNSEGIVPIFSNTTVNNPLVLYSLKEKNNTPIK